MSSMNALEEKIALADTLRTALFPALEQLQKRDKDLPLGVLPALQKAHERLVDEIRAELIPRHLTWRDVLDIRTPSDLAGACQLAQSAGYAFILWNERVYPSRKRWHQFLLKDPAPRMQDVGLVPKVCSHPPQAVAQLMPARWCSDCGALCPGEGPDPWQPPRNSVPP